MIGICKVHNRTWSSAYMNYKCRCEDCRKAKSESDLALGVDPGWYGMIALVTIDTILEVHKIPSHKNTGDHTHVGAKHAKKKINVLKLQEIISKLPIKKIDISFMENVWPRPRDGKKSICTMCKNSGILTALFELNGVVLTQVEPSVWKERLNVTKDKDTSINLVKKIYGKRQCNKFNALDDDNVAEAILVGYYGLKYGEIA